MSLLTDGHLPCFQLYYRRHCLGRPCLYTSLCAGFPLKGGDARSIYVYSLIGMLQNCHPPPKKVSLPLAFILDPQKARSLWVLVDFKMAGWLDVPSFTMLSVCPRLSSLLRCDEGYHCPFSQGAHRWGSGRAAGAPAAVQGRLWWGAGVTPGVRWPLVLLGLHGAKGSPVATTLACHCNSRGREGVWKSSVFGAVNSSGLSQLPKRGKRPRGGDGAAVGWGVLALVPSWVSLSLVPGPEDSANTCRKPSLLLGTQRQQMLRSAQPGPGLASAVMGG